MTVIATGALFTATPANAASCSTAYHHPHSAKAQTCRRHGWTIDVSYAPVGDQMVKDVLVVGPHGHVYVDTFGQYGNVR